MTLEGRIVGVRRETSGTRIVRVHLDGQRFRFRAGQAALIAPPDSVVRAPYSIASAPGETDASGALEFLIRTEASGAWGEAFPPLRRGMRLAVEGPIGSFAFPSRVRDSRLLFIAGGTGVAPIRSMIRHARLTGYSGHIRMLYSARTPYDFAYLRELRGMARRGEIELLLTVTRESAGRWRGERGRVAADRLATLLAEGPTRCFVCGPAAMIADIPALLTGLGVPKDRIHLEQWGG